MMPAAPAAWATAPAGTGPGAADCTDSIGVVMESMALVASAALAMIMVGLSNCFIDLGRWVESLLWPRFVTRRS
jgi:hypothetical protein